MFMIKTNVHGCITGDYYAESIPDKITAEGILKKVLHGDTKAEIVEVKFTEHTDHKEDL